MADNDSRTVTVVGAGIAGLVAAITAAEQGARVSVHEAGRFPGGRARTREGEWKANFGPHALYGDGPFLPWLRSNGVLPELVRPPATGFRLRWNGSLRRMPVALVRAIVRLTGEAPMDVSFREWGKSRTSEPVVRAAIGMASLPTFHSDPGELSAAFVAERLRRVTRRAASVRYVLGGWTTLIDRLAARAHELGVELHLGSQIIELPKPPVVVATSAANAARLLDRDLPAHGTRVALLDIGIDAPARQAPFAVLDLDERSYLARYSAVDPSLAPAGAHLIQACTPLRDDEEHAAGTRRLEHALDQTLPRWRERCRWRHAALATSATGVVDQPGHDWQNRPPIDRGDGVFIAGDYVATPGLLSEVSWASGVEAGTAAAVYADDRANH